MNTQLQTFDELEKDLTKNYNVAEPVENYELTEKEVDIFEEPKKEEVLSDEFNDDMSEIKKFFANS